MRPHNGELRSFDGIMRRSGFACASQYKESAFGGLIINFWTLERRPAGNREYAEPLWLTILMLAT